MKISKRMPHWTDGHFKLLLEKQQNYHRGSSGKSSQLHTCYTSGRKKKAVYKASQVRGRYGGQFVFTYKGQHLMVTPGRQFRRSFLFEIFW